MQRQTIGAHKYAAFISYRHTEADRAWAEWLHKALETYRTPRGLVQGQGVRARLDRVFRDEEELPVSADLNADIENALVGSEHLIVICSPRTVESAWVNREVERFSELRRESEVHAILIEGDPTRSFPPALQELHSSGGVSRRERDPNPSFLVDARPRSGEGVRARHDRVKLQVLAALLRCPLEDLRGGESKRRRGRLLTAGAAGLLFVGLLAGIFAFASAGRERAQEDAKRIAASQEAQETARAAASASSEEARQRRVALYVDQGRKELLAGRAGPAAVFLAGAYENGEDGIALRHLLGRACQELEAHLLVHRDAEAPISTLGWSPDGERLVVATETGTLRVVQVSDGRTILELGEAGEHLSDVSYTNDGATIVTFGSSERRLWNAATGALLEQEKHYGGGRGVANPRGDMFASTSRDEDTVHVLDPRGRSLAKLEGHEGPIVGVAWSADGETLGTGGRDGTARLWHARTGEERSRLDGEPADLKAVALSPDGKCVAVATKSGIRVWRVGQAKAAVEFEIPGGVSAPPAFSADGRRLAVPSANGVVSVWTRSGCRIGDVSTTDREVQGIEFARRGLRLAVRGSEGSLDVWDLARMPWAQEIGENPQDMYLAAFGPGERTVGAIEGDALTTWDAGNGSPLAARFLSAHSGGIQFAEIARDGTRLVTAGTDAVARLWDLETARMIRGLRGHQGRVRTARLSRDGSLVVTASEDGTAALWTASDGTRRHVLTGHEGAVRYGMFDPEVKRVVTAGEDGTVRLWSVETGALLHTLRGHEKPVWGAIFIGNDTVVSGGDENIVCVWDANTGERRAEIPFPGLSSFGGPEEGRAFYTTGAGGKAVVWTTRGEQICALDGHTKDVFSASFTDDGSRIATVSEDGTGRVWDVRTGEELLRLQGHEGPVYSVDLDRVGERAVTVGRAGEILVWDTRVGLLVARLDVPARRAWFTPDGEAVLLYGGGPGYLCDARSGEYLRALAGPDVDAPRISPDGKRLLVDWPAVFDMTTGGRLLDLGRKASICDLAFGSDGLHALLVDESGTVRVHDAKDGREVSSFEVGETVETLVDRWGPKDGPTKEVTTVRAVAFDRPGARLAAIGASGSLKVWSVAEQEVVVEVADVTPADAVAFSPDGTRILTADRNSGRLWDAATGELLFQLEGYPGLVESTFEPSEGKWLLTFSLQGLLVLDGKTGEVLRELPVTGAEPVRASFSADGTRVALLADHGKTAHVLDTGTGASLAVIPCPDKDWQWVALDADGTRVVTVDDDKIPYFWDTTRTPMLREVTAFEQRPETAVYGPGGQRLLTTTQEGSDARLWNTATGDLVAKLDGKVLKVRFSASGDRVALLGGDLIRVLRTEDGTEMSRAEIDGFPEDCRFDADAVRVITSASGKLSVWDGITGRRHVRLAGLPAMYTIAIFSPDGSQIATAAEDGTARLWDAHTGEETALLPGAPMSISVESRFDFSSLAFHPSGERIVTGGIEGKVRVWNTRTGEELAQFEAHENKVQSLHYSMDGTRILSQGGEEDRSFRVWDADSGELVGELLSHGEALDPTALDAEHRRLVVAGEAGIRVLDVESGEVVATLPKMRRTPVGVAIATGGTHVAVLDYVRDGGAMRLWRSGVVSPSVSLVGHRGEVFAAEFTSDGTRVVSSGEDGIVRVWDVVSGALLARSSEHAGETAVTGCEFSPDGTHLVTTAMDWVGKIWDVATGECVRTLIQDGEFLFGAHYSRDGKRILTTGVSDSCMIWNAGDGTPIVRLSGHGESVLTAEFDAAATRVVTQGKDNTIRVWNVSDGRLLAMFTDPGMCSISSNGSRVATSARQSKLWNATSGEEIADLPGSPTFGPRGAVVVAHMGDGKIGVYDAESGKLRHELEGHDAGALVGAFDADGGRLITTSEDHTARVWDLRTGALLHVLEGHTKRVSDAAFLPALEMIVTGGDDETVRLWDAATGELLTVIGIRGNMSDFVVAPSGQRVLANAMDCTVLVAPVLEERPPEVVADLVRRLVPLRLEDDHLVPVGAESDGR